jgi:DUF4097 and DUF4098 domain-containing protein YvlB
MRPKLFDEFSAFKIFHRPRFILGSLIGATVAVVILLAATTGCSLGPTETREDSFIVAGSSRVVVNSVNGNIEINAGLGNEVLVQATLRDAPRVKYELSQVGNTITVDVQTSKRWWVFGSAGVDVTITVPPQTDVDLDTSNGFIELHGLEGSGSLKSSNGKIVLDNMRGNFDGRTSNGRIEVNAVEGSVILKTSNGKIDVRSVQGEFDVESSNGSVFYNGNMTAGGSNRLVTSNGDVVVELQGKPSVVLDAETSNGEVTSELPILATVTRKERLVGKIGEGEADLYIRTSNGDVTIR